MSAMRFLLFLAPMLIAAAPVSVDHVTVAGRDLKAMQAALKAAGIAAEYGGPHANRVTEMALASFADGSYLELIAPQPNADPKALQAHYWAKQMESDAGPCAWAARVKDMNAEIERLRAAGVAVTAPARSGRTRPDGTRLEWETAQVGTEPNGTFFPFLIRDLTPRRERAFPSGKPTTRDFSGVTHVVIAVRSLEDSVKRYRQAYGLPAPIKQVDASFGAQMALLGDVPVILAAPLNAESWLVERLDRFGEGPCAFILGARRTGPYKAAAKTRWFGIDISWFDEAKLGWRLGFESVM
jgi:hypothetical protein